MPEFSPRIVSLVPSITELLIDLGLAPWLIGRTGFCIHPAQIVQNIAKVGGTKDVNLAKIKQLAPTHIFVNVDENELPLVEQLRKTAAHVIVTHPCSLEDNCALIEQVITTFPLLFQEHSAHILRAKSLQLSVENALQSLKKSKNSGFSTENVLYLIWRKPWMTVAQDTYISRMLSLIGWQTFPQLQGGASGSARYPKLAGDEPWLKQIHRVLLSSEPYTFTEQHIQEVQTWLPHANVQLVNGEMLSWYGSRSVLGLAYLQTLLEQK